MSLHDALHEILFGTVLANTAILIGVLKWAIKELRHIIKSVETLVLEHQEMYKDYVALKGEIDARQKS